MPLMTTATTLALYVQYQCISQQLQLTLLRFCWIQHGTAGHIGTDNSSVVGRISRYGEWQGGVSENIVYGFDHGMVLHDQYCSRRLDDTDSLLCGLPFQLQLGTLC